MEQTVGSTTDFSTRVRSSGSDLRRPSRQMGFFDTVLWPLKVAVAWIMVQAHDALTFLGMDPAGGWTWVLSIVEIGRASGRGRAQRGKAPVAGDGRTQESVETVES